uniref:Uncharacterized protein n=1 Tax=Rhizophora mucronata TaxID=61149 RepID=A0A2P2PT15_RHIMU
MWQRTICLAAAFLSCIPSFMDLLYCYHLLENNSSFFPSGKFCC